MLQNIRTPAKGGMPAGSAGTPARAGLPETPVTSAASGKPAKESTPAQAGTQGTTETKQSRKFSNSREASKRENIRNKGNASNTIGASNSRDASNSREANNSGDASSSRDYRNSRDANDSCILKIYSINSLIWLKIRERSNKPVLQSRQFDSCKNIRSLFFQLYRVAAINPEHFQSLTVALKNHIF